MGSLPADPQKPVQTERLLVWFGKFMIRVHACPVCSLQFFSFAPTTQIAPNPAACFQVLPSAVLVHRSNVYLTHVSLAPSIHHSPGPPVPVPIPYGNIVRKRRPFSFVSSFTPAMPCHETNHLARKLRYPRFSHTGSPLKGKLDDLIESRVSHLSK